MIQKSPIRVSLVIPAYNEESHLALCLDAIAAQTVKPFEVIVVDNNSTDQTVAVARRYPFVRVLHESRQGVVYARDRGFNAARGDVIGRTDADTALASNWVATLQEVFADLSVDAASGGVDYRNIGLKHIFDTIDERFRCFLARRTSKLGEMFLYGVNMGIRTSAWKNVRGHLCHERRFAEDLDLAAHLIESKAKVILVPAMRATILPRQAASGPREFYKYVWSGPLTCARHGMVGQRYTYPMALFVTCLYLPIRLAYLGYDPERRRFSFTYLMHSDVQPRVSPVSELL
jgi:glycosyltransferase involved in cell wall biosynthesis